MNQAFLADVTAMILTCNEVENIERTLSQLRRVRRIVVIDSGSDDGTLEILARHPRVEVIPRRFDTFAAQCNFGLARMPADCDWVLSLDADYVLSDALLDELDALSPSPEVGGYRMRFRYCIAGRPIRSGIYPPVVTLFRRSGARYVEDGHAHRVVVDGRVDDVSGRIDHDDRKPLSRWFGAQRRYARKEAERLAVQPFAAMGWPDRVRAMIFAAPPAVFAYVLLARGGILDGWRGVFYALQRAYAEMLLSIELVRRRFRRESAAAAPSAREHSAS